MFMLDLVASRIRYFYILKCFVFCRTISRVSVHVKSNSGDGSFLGRQTQAASSSLRGI